MHTYLRAGAAVHLAVESTSIEGVDGFYAQVANEALKPRLLAFAEMECKMTEYAAAHNSTNEWNSTTNRWDVGIYFYNWRWSLTRNNVLNLCLDNDISLERLI